VRTRSPANRSGRIGRLAAPLVVAALVAASCGQLGGVHKDTLTARNAAARNGSVQPSPNGENNGPSQPRPGYIVVTVVNKRAFRVPSVRAGSYRGLDPLRICPVQGRGYFSDDFGAPRYSGGFHHHAGNDMFAQVGTPIVAPFDGTAIATPNGLGGNAVTVYGLQGYVYNAHLSAYGNLGAVKMGTVVGYVGNTGDAMGGPYHDHFEWHPATLPGRPWVSPFGLGEVGGAVDPYPYLEAVCH
jgi:murein DD-endopeptidase MepM/ murein hydrolase activator NlpD